MTSPRPHYLQLRVGAAAALMLALAACGSEDSEPPPPTDSAAANSAEPATSEFEQVDLNVDVNACSALAESDLAELQLRAGSQNNVEGQGSFDGVWSTCHWLGSQTDPNDAAANSVALTVQDADSDISDSGEPLDLGDGGTITDDRAEWSSGGYVLSLEGSNVRAVAERIEANGGPQTPYLTDFATPALVGGPDTAICDYIDVEAFAGMALDGDGPYMSWPYTLVEARGNQRIGCTIQGRAGIQITKESEPISIDELCNVEGVPREEIEGREACVGDMDVTVVLDETTWLFLDTGRSGPVPDGAAVRAVQVWDGTPSQ